MAQQQILKASAVCARSLRANLRTIAGPDGRRRTVLTAGPHQFRSVRTRDFCFASGGLLAAGEVRAVRDTLDEIISRQRTDGLFPRLLDTYSSATRFARALTGGLIPLKAPLAANYISGHFVTPIDSNSLIAWTAARYVRRSGNIAWAGLVLPRLERGMAYYDALETDGFIYQPPFSDWKTVSARAGAVFFTQLLRWKAMRSIKELCLALGRTRAAAVWKSRVRALARRTHKAFWDCERGFFKDTLRHPLLSADGNLAAAAWGFADDVEAARIVRAMDRRELLTPWGPRAGERYRAGKKSYLVRLAGIAGYHDDFVWLWNTALEMRVQHSLGRAARLKTLLASVSRLLEESGRVSEVHRPGDGREARSWLYRSEKPFSWSAGMLLEAFNYLTAEPVPAAGPTVGAAP